MRIIWWKWLDYSRLSFEIWCAVMSANPDILFDQAITLKRWRDGELVDWGTYRGN